MVNGSIEKIVVDKDVYRRINMLRAKLSAKKKKALTWDDFLELLMRKERKKEEFINWLYTLGIFIAITFVLMFPIYLMVPLAALSLIPFFILIGLISALFSAYILTSWSLRGIKPFENAPSSILKSLERLSSEAGVRKVKLMILETPEINAMAYTSLSGNHVCITRGLMDAYQSGKIDEGELEAILGHEIGHIKNRDCLRFSFVLSWIEIFDKIGTVFIIIGTAIAGIGVALEVTAGEEEKGRGAIIAIFGWMLAVAGFMQKLLAKIASILAFHLSRKQEYAADMIGAELVHPEKMASALRKVEELNNELIAKELASLPYADRWQLQPRNPSWIDRLFCTHPPTEKRIAVLRTIDEFLTPR